MNYKILFFFFLLLSSVNLLSQSPSDLANQAENLGISSQEDVLRELQRRGMTVQDAERMALIYGIDYNDYISQYITVNDVASSATLPVVSELVVQGDSIQEILNYSGGLNAKKYVRLSGGKLSTTSGKPFVIYPSGKAKKVGFLRNPKVYPGCEVFVPFEEKTTFLGRLGQGISQSLDRIVQMSTFTTAIITTIYLVKNFNK